MSVMRQPSSAAKRWRTVLLVTLALATAAPAANAPPGRPAETPERPAVVARMTSVAGPVPEAAGAPTRFGTARLVVARKPDGRPEYEVHVEGGTAKASGVRFAARPPWSRGSVTGLGGVPFLHEGEVNQIPLADVSGMAFIGAAFEVMVSFDTRPGKGLHPSIPGTLQIAEQPQRTTVTHTFRLGDVPAGRRVVLVPESSRYEEIDPAPEPGMDPFAAWDHPEGQLELTIPDARPSGAPNTILLERAGRRFVFDPTTGSATFDTPLASGRMPRMVVNFAPAPAGHIVQLGWGGRDARLSVDHKLAVDQSAGSAPAR
jgi:hypothetical protein